MRVAVIGVGNRFRRDDGVGPAAAAEIERLGRPEVAVTVTDGEPTQLMDAWAGADLAIIVDAVLCRPAAPGRVHRTELGELVAGAGATSSHGLGIPEAIELARVLDRVPARVVVFAVEAADVGFGDDLSPAVAAAIPELVAAIAAELPG